MKRLILSLLLLSGCGGTPVQDPEVVADKPSDAPPVEEMSTPDFGEPPSLSDITLVGEKSNYETTLIREEKADSPVETPPDALFDLVYYPSPLGGMPAYISKPADTTKKHPAIVWIVGGFSNSISDVAWADADPENDQSASVFWKAGIVTMYPSLRGGNENPGYVETCYGEVDDIIAAARHLKTVGYVDPDRIYLGGHSTGGTLALLVAASTDLFRGVFSLGPVDDVRAYGQENLTFDVEDNREASMRAPVNWLHNIKTPTFVFEGSDGNIDSLYALDDANTNSLIHFYALVGYSHFNIIGRVSKLLALKITKDRGEKPDMRIAQEEVAQALRVF